MNEASVRVGVRRYLRRLRMEGYPCEFVSIHGDIYAIGEPDILGCINGRAFAIELKAPGEKSRKIQVARQNQWERSGALVLRDITDWTQVEAVFKENGLV